MTGKQSTTANIELRAKRKLWQRFTELYPHRAVDQKGYVKSPEQNLVAGIDVGMFERDLSDGSGNEFESKFLAVHSSSALAVNTFALWKSNPQSLTLCNVSGFNKLTFEKKCSTGLGGTPPNLDVLLESEAAVIGIESKFLEYQQPKKPKFSPSYSRDKLPQVEDHWWIALEHYRNAPHQHLDVAQLIKHYLGIRKQYGHKDTKVLLYLFWEPKNASELPAFARHRQEIKEFADSIEGNSVRFVAMSYPELWNNWNSWQDLSAHVVNLQRRYLVGI